jgi:UPF0042 nucleotide-binding protein
MSQTSNKDIAPDTEDSGPSWCVGCDAGEAVHATEFEGPDGIKPGTDCKKDIDSEDAAARLAEVRRVLSAFDWERDDRQYALEEIERIVSGMIKAECRDYDPVFKLHGCDLEAGHAGPHRDLSGYEWDEHLPDEPGRCGSHAPWGSGWSDQRCTLDTGHDGQHRDRSGNEWGPERDAAPVTIVSFGYGHDAPPEAHATFDVRHHFKDPHVRPDLRDLTGDSPAVVAVVMSTPGVERLICSITATAQAFLGGSQHGPVTIAVGCVGGRHRSAVIADQAASRLRDLGITATATHRDKHRPVIARPATPACI